MSLQREVTQKIDNKSYKKTSMEMKYSAKLSIFFAKHMNYLAHIVVHSYFLFHEDRSGIKKFYNI